MVQHLGLVASLFVPSLLELLRPPLRLSKLKKRDTLRIPPPRVGFVEPILKVVASPQGTSDAPDLLALIAWLLLFR